MLERKPAPRLRKFAASATIIALSGLLVAADAPTGGEPNVRAFVLSNIYVANPSDAGGCPAMADGGLEAFLKSLPPEEQAKYGTPDKRPELEMLMGQRLGFRRTPARHTNGKYPGKLPASLKPGDVATPEQALEIGALNGFPKGKGRLAFQNFVVAYDSCTNPEDFPMLAKGFVTYSGATAVGMNLDGKVSKEDFTGADGTKGVDNQLWRAVGCIKPFREGGDYKIAKKTFMSARAPTVIELRGVDDVRNDTDVTVNVYATADPVVRDARGEALAGASFVVDPDPRLRATARGRIVNGVLTTDPVDLVLNYKEQIVDAPRIIRGARIRAELKADGSIEGSIFGYYTLASYWNSIEQMTQNGANLSQLSCPGVRQAIDRLADGYRDPRTGKYTAISSAYNFFGVHAFVIGSPGVRVASGAN